MENANAKKVEKKLRMRERRELAENSNEMGVPGHIACLQSFTSLIVNVWRVRACTPESFCSDHFIHLHCCDKDRRLVGKMNGLHEGRIEASSQHRHSKRQHIPFLFDVDLNNIESLLDKLRFYSGLSGI